MFYFLFVLVHNHKMSLISWLGCAKNRIERMIFILFYFLCAQNGELIHVLSYGCVAV